MNALANILGKLLALAGGFMVFAFLIDQATGSQHSFPVALSAAILFGLLPLFSGGLLMLHRYRRLKNSMTVVFSAYSLLLVLCAASFRFVSERFLKPISVAAASALIGMALSGIIWLIAWGCSRARRPGKTD